MARRRFHFDDVEPFLITYLEVFFSIFHIMKISKSMIPFFVVPNYEKNLVKFIPRYFTFVPTNYP